MKATLTNTLILLSAMLATALTFWGLMASVKLERPHTLTTIELALPERHQQDSFKTTGLTCNCVSDGSWHNSFAARGGQVGCSPAYMVIANRQAIGPCPFPEYIESDPLRPSPVPQIPAGLFRAGA
ncbi:MAG: hypothetical protein VX447_07735 [Pseudomonadota bacterium]|uniref:hypothetical protein n=1 Tax=Gallaecimonas pentaromativorans TaxID=584787 RepID=UPI00067F5AC9|nr:hypothetical protein [Gallaecimonas pentaromativorans]MED5524625.1 hypothetical protein [Pseudomonadota bacterium]